MKVKDLIAELQKADPESPVVMQSDPEGNSYSPLAGADCDSFFKKDGYDLSVYHSKWTAPECCLEEDEYNELKNKSRCVVLWPS